MQLALSVAKLRDMYAAFESRRKYKYPICPRKPFAKMLTVELRAFTILLFKPGYFTRDWSGKCHVDLTAAVVQLLPVEQECSLLITRRGACVCCCSCSILLL